MEKRFFLLSVVLVVFFCGSAAFALDPMGPPAAGLKQGQWSAGIEYSYSEMDLKGTHGKYNWSGYWWYYEFGYGYFGDYVGDSGDLPSIKLKTKMHKVYARLGLGIQDNWEVFGRIGTSNVDFEGEGVYYYFYDELEGDTECAIGAGTKVTLWESGNLKLGALAQFSWTESDAKISGRDVDDDDVETWSVSSELEIYEIQLAAGPTYQLMEGVLIYGGPFFHLVHGDLEVRDSWEDMWGSDIGWGRAAGEGKATFDVKHRSCFGGYLGGQANIAENASINAEWQHTPDADLVGGAFILRF
jgi:hypothetical protein